MNLPITSIFPLGIGVSVDVSSYQLHLFYSALPCYCAVQPYMYLSVHVHVHILVHATKSTSEMWTYLIQVFSQNLWGSECSEHSAAHPARPGKYRGISNYLVVSLLQNRMDKKAIALPSG